ncbi:MAG: P1 family peptidase, partial [Oscillospiraceae bacterium]
ECNDGYLNDIRGLHITEQNVLDAIKNAAETFEEGAVGSGTGMACMGFKGGIGSSSRVIKLGEDSYTVGALVMSNFGSAGNLLLGGDHIGERIEKALQDEKDKGSIMMILATDVPLSERQLKRVAKRAGAGLARTGSIYGNGSGDISIAFTTANRVPHYAKSPVIDMKMVDDEQIDPVFRAAAEAVEEAIISSLCHAETTVGRAGHKKVSLKEYL